MIKYSPAEEAYIEACAEIDEFAQLIELPYDYVMEEFVIDGVLVKE